MEHPPGSLGEEIERHVAGLDVVRIEIHDRYHDVLSIRSVFGVRQEVLVVHLVEVHVLGAGAVDRGLGQRADGLQRVPRQEVTADQGKGDGEQDRQDERPAGYLMPEVKGKGTYLQPAGHVAPSGKHRRVHDAQELLIPIPIRL